MAAYVPFAGPASGDLATTPDTGDTYEELNIYIRVDNFDLDYAAYQCIGGWQSNQFAGGIAWWMRNSAASYRAYLDVEPGTDGLVGTTGVSETAGVTLRWLRLRLDYPPSGTGTLVKTLYESNDNTEDYAAVSWTQVEVDNDSLSGTTVPVNPGGSITLGGVPWATASDKPVFDLVRAVFEADGTVIADFYPNGDAASAGDTSWADPQGNTWTLTSTSVSGTPDGRGQYEFGDAAFTDTPGDFAASGQSFQGVEFVDTPGDFAVTAFTDRGGPVSMYDVPVGFAVVAEAVWQQPAVTYSDEIVAIGSLPTPTTGGVMASGVRIVGSGGSVIYSTFNEDDAVKLPIHVDEVTDVADGVVTRSGGMTVWLDSPADEIPAAAPFTAAHPLRSWSGALVEIYQGWEVEESAYSIVRTMARRATLAVGRSSWVIEDAGHRVDVDLVDLRELLDSDLDQPWSIPSGTNVVTALQDLVVDRFGPSLDIQTVGADWTLPAMETDAGESRLALIEEIETGSGWGVSFDLFGRCIIGPQLDVLVDHEPSFVFSTDAGRGWAPVAPLENRFADGAPSGVRLTVSSVPEEADEIEVEVWDSDPASPTYWEAGSGGDLEPIMDSVSSEAIDGEQMATRAAWARLRRVGRGGGDVIEFRAPPIPQLLAGVPVLLDIPGFGLEDAWYVVERVSCPLRPGVMTIKARPSWDPTNGTGDI